MPVNTKSCNCKSNNWILIQSRRIDSLGTEKVEWCKNCGTVKLSSIPNGATQERTIDYRVPDNSPNLRVVKDRNNSQQQSAFYKEG